VVTLFIRGYICLHLIIFILFVCVLCSLGIGSELVKHLLSQGAIVHATDLKMQSLEKVFQYHMNDTHLFLYEMDVTQQSQIDNAYQMIQKRTANDGLFGLVNNAGIVYSPEHEDLKLSCELNPEKDILPVVEVNLLGPMRVVSTFTPVILQHSTASSPIIVNVASIAGRIALPFGGVYSATKFAIVGWSDTLRKEFSLVSSINKKIRVSCIEPSFVDTPLLKGIERKTNNRKSSLFYDDIVLRYSGMLKNLLWTLPKIKAVDVANAIVEELTSIPARRHVIVPNGWLGWFFYNILFWLPLAFEEWGERMLSII